MEPEIHFSSRKRALDVLVVVNIVPRESVWISLVEFPEDKWDFGKDLGDVFLTERGVWQGLLLSSILRIQILLLPLPPHHPLLLLLDQLMLPDHPQLLPLHFF